MEEQSLAIAELTIDLGIGVRAQIYEDTVQEYMECLDDLPAVTVFLLPTGEKMLVDGFHRIEAARRLGRTHIPALMRAGTPQQAREQAIKANLRHGRRYTRQEREAAACAMLRLHPDWADNLLSRELHRTVSAPTIAKYRQRLEEQGEIPRQERLVGADGRTRPAAYQVTADSGGEAGGSPGAPPGAAPVDTAATWARERESLSGPVASLVLPAASPATTVSIPPLTWPLPAGARWQGGTDSTAALYGGAIREILATLPTASCHVVIATPPPPPSPEDEDGYIEQLCGLSREWARLLHPEGALFLFTLPHLAARVEVMAVRPLFRVLGVPIWAKPPYTATLEASAAPRSYLVASERIIFAESRAGSGQRPFQLVPQRPCTDVWTFLPPRIGGHLHPQEHPVELLEHILFTASVPGSVVLACYAGRGEAAEASLRLRRHCIAIEEDEHWAERAVVRLAGVELVV